MDSLETAQAPNNNKSTTIYIDLDREKTISLEIQRRLSSLNLGFECVVGLRLPDQLKALAQCNVIICHNGSTSAKYLWMLNKPTFVHGPITPPKFTNTTGIMNLPPGDPRSHHVGLVFANAFRGEAHAPECYLDQSGIYDIQCLDSQPHEIAKWMPNYRINSSIATNQFLNFIDSISI